MAGLISFPNKSALITKIYVPRWIIIVASTIQSTLIFLMNLIIIVIFFVWYGVWPGLMGILTFVFYIMLTYTIIISFSFIAAPLYVQYRDLSHIWEVVSAALFYAAPIVYPLNILPSNYQPIILANPMGFIIHYTKTALTENHWAPFWQNATFASLVLIFFFISLLIFSRLESRVADNL